jgi:hypothetical protein
LAGRRLLYNVKSHHVVWMPFGQSLLRGIVARGTPTSTWKHAISGD